MGVVFGKTTKIRPHLLWSIYGGVGLVYTVLYDGYLSSPYPEYDTPVLPALRFGVGLGYLR